MENQTCHTFHIPVMGTGASADTPIHVSPFGISSVISLVDDKLLERLREFYSEKYRFPYSPIAKEENSRAKRIKAYLDLVKKIVIKKLDAMKKQTFFDGKEKRKYFDLLPDGNSLKEAYLKLLNMNPGVKRDNLERNLTRQMKPGSIDVNIMSKMDRENFDNKGNRLDTLFSDAKAALQGFATSHLKSNVIFSAGINPALYNYLTQFQEFYRDKTGEIKKKIVLKVNDFRSAFIQAKYLAKKGLEVSEFRIESGLNCGGHAFSSSGNLLPWLLREFKEKRDQLVNEFKPLIEKYYEKMGWPYQQSNQKDQLVITAQGGIGTAGEDQRLRKDFGVNRTGWASPFLLVPEVTSLDVQTRDLLKKTTQKDIYLSDVSPLGIPFNNLKNSGSELAKIKRIKDNRPGSPCLNGNARFNTEFTTIPICTASREYQKKKLEEINSLSTSDEDKNKLKDRVLEKSCICNNLGNGVLKFLGIKTRNPAPTAICPGPNVAWFNKLYSLTEMVDHIYGRGVPLTSINRPHMFANEIVINVDYFEKRLADSPRTEETIKTFEELKNSLEENMKYCLSIAQQKPYPGENLASIPMCISEQRTRLNNLFSSWKKDLKN